MHSELFVAQTSHLTASPSTVCSLFSSFWCISNELIPWKWSRCATQSAFDWWLDNWDFSKCPLEKCVIVQSCAGIYLFQVEKVLFQIPKVTKATEVHTKQMNSDWWMVNAPVFEPVIFPFMFKFWFKIFLEGFFCLISLNSKAD